MYSKSFLCGISNSKNEIEARSMNLKKKDTKTRLRGKDRSHCSYLGQACLSCISIEICFY